MALDRNPGYLAPTMFVILHDTTLDAASFDMLGNLIGWEKNWGNGNNWRSEAAAEHVLKFAGLANVASVREYVS